MEKNAIFASAALLLFLIFTPLVTAEVIVLQYDDGEMDGNRTALGQVVRFTTPSNGFSCKLEKLNVFLSQYNTNTSAKLSIWKDNGSELTEDAIGELIVEKDVTVAEMAIYQLNFSDVDITFEPGESFFAGWTSENELIAYHDITDPNGRTLHKHPIGWIDWPSDCDAPVSVELSYAKPEILGSFPDSCARGSRLSMTITTDDAADLFRDGTSSIEDVWLSRGDDQISSTGFIPTDSNSLTATFDLPTDADLGEWDINIESAIYGELTPLANAFTVLASPDLDRDGNIDIIDFNFFIKYWLQDTNDPPVNMLIPAEQPGANNLFPAPAKASSMPPEYIILQYSDLEMEDAGAALGQAVRFTIPTNGSSFKLELMAIYLAQYNDNTSAKFSIWNDNGGELTSDAIGELLFEQEVTVAEFSTHYIDLSETNLTFRAGDSFFGGWTSENELNAAIDKSDPNGRTLHKHPNGWFDWPEDCDAPVLVELSYVLPTLDNVSPDSCARGSQVSLVVDANDAEFSQDGLSTIDDVWLSKDETIIHSTGFTPIDSNSLIASFVIPADAEIGSWDVYVVSTITGQMAPLTEAFTIFASPDLNRDAKVDLNDFNLFSKHWQEKIVKLPDNILVTGGAFEMGSHFPEAESDELDPNTVTVDDFYMSNFEISNQQYCYFLNSAISKGDITVDRNVVYSSQDASNTYPYFTCNGGLPESQIQHSSGIFAVKSGISRDMTLNPAVAVSWYGAAAYCNWRSVKEKKEVCYDTSTWICDFTKNGYRLPTEAEWEYAARAGKTDPYLRFNWGDIISHNEANYFADSKNAYDTSGESPGIYHPDYELDDEPYTAPAGSFAANSYGLFDMAGNAWEWCYDRYSNSYYNSGENDNPTGPANGDFRVMRGGSWQNNASFCRTASRNFNIPESMDMYTGFRVCFRSPVTP